MGNDYIAESGITGAALSAALHVMMRSIHAKGRDRSPEEDAPLWESMFRISRLGALMGDAGCMSSLADIYYGQKTEETKNDEGSFDEAIKWWQKAAEAGDGRAATNLGLLYMQKEIPGAGSHGVLEFDAAKALEYFIMGHENGDMKAGRHVGLCYRDGVGTEKDAAKAFEWFEKAAERGDSSSALYMADCILKGEGTEQNIPDAISRYSALVECEGHDVTTGAYALGHIYYDGEYLPKNTELAKTFFESVVRTATMKEQHLKEEAEEILKEL